MEALIWPAIYACQDLFYSVGVRSWFCDNLGPVHMELVKYVLWYVFKTLDLDVKFDGEVDRADDVIRYTDSDFARSKTDRKLIGGYVFILVRAAISHFSKLLSIVILLTYEVEYIAIYKVGKEAIWLGYLLAELGFWKRSTPVTLYTNNQGSIALSNNSEFH